MDTRNTRRTARACMAGSANQAIVTNLSALLFVPFMRLYGLNALQMGLLTAVGFAAQMCADCLLLFLVDRVGTRKLACAAAAMSCAGLWLYGAVPYLFENIYGGIVAATVIFAFAGGMLEVVLSNVADGLPSGKGGASLNLLHTVYAWSQVALCLFLFVWLVLFGAECWNGAVFILSFVPMVAFVLLFFAHFPRRVKEASVRAGFQPFYLFALLAVFFGYGAEVVMNQWITSFVAGALDSETGGILGGCALFALCLGLGGSLYVGLLQRRNKPSNRVLIVSALITAVLYIGAALLPEIPALICAALCGLSVGFLSPGAKEAASDFLPHTGGWMLASLAISQDVGAAVLPASAGWLAGIASMRASFLCLAAAPALAALSLFAMSHIRGRSWTKAEKVTKKRQRNFKETL